MSNQSEQALPTDLREADDVLAKYGRWALGGQGQGRCGSAEGRYQSDEVHAREDREIREPMIADWSAMDVQRALCRVPERFRKVLQAHYIQRRNQMWITRRQLRLTAKTWSETRIAGVRMFWNIYRLHYLKK